MMAAKIGLEQCTSDDRALLEELNEVLQLTETDMTIVFRSLANFQKSDSTAGGRPLLKWKTFRGSVF